MDNEHQQHLNELRNIYVKRLRALERQAASKGQDTPPHISLEIEDTEHKIREIDNLLSGKTPTAGQKPILSRRGWIIISTSLILLLLLAVGLYIADFNRLSIDELSFAAFDWTDSTLPNEKGWTNLSIINSNQPHPAYKLDYTMPSTNTKYSGGGISFSFSKPQNLESYKAIKINITFDSPDASCSFDMRDIAKNVASVPIGIQVSHNQDIQVENNGNTQILTIPLDTYYHSINRTAVLDMGCAVGTDFTRGNHHFIINDITFVRWW